ncbi:hypothetical protein [Streptomyces sp. NPDC059949]|uniref:hypothetical protein n=1 Tax=Streptomyces sp. NPDC059949 TaxID=3347013 RepID=UPI00364A26BE
MSRLQFVNTVFGRPRWAMPLALALAAGVGLTSCALSEIYLGCEGKPLKNVAVADVVGTYAGHPRGELTLSEDGTLSVADWMDDPDYDAVGNITTHPTLPTTGKGTWKLERDPFDKDWMEVHVKLELQDGGSMGMSLHITGTKQQPKLHHVLGDPDECDEMLLTKRS